MKYDFTSILERHGKDAIAVDGLGKGFAPPAPKEGVDAIPMWVADMNFPTVPTIQEAIIERAKHPAFGYFRLQMSILIRLSGGMRRGTGLRALKGSISGMRMGCWEACFQR